MSRVLIRFAILVVAIAASSCGGGGDGPVGPFVDCSTIATHAIGTTASGVLDADDCRHEGTLGRVDYHRFTMGARGPVSFTIHLLDAVHPISVGIRGIGEVPIDHATISPGSYAMIGGMLSAGEYYVSVFTPQDPAGLAYSIESAPTLPPLFDCVAIVPLTIGSTVSGTLSDSDCPSPSNNGRGDYYQFTLPTAGPVALTVQSAEGSTQIRATLTTAIPTGVQSTIVQPGETAVIGGTLPAGTYVLSMSASIDYGRAASYVMSTAAAVP